MTNIRTVFHHCEDQECIKTSVFFRNHLRSKEEESFQCLFLAGLYCVSMKAQHHNIKRVQWSFHNATTIKLSEIAQFYEPINRTNWIVYNNKLSRFGWMSRNCIHCDCFLMCHSSRTLNAAFHRIEKLLLLLSIFSWFCETFTMMTTRIHNTWAAHTLKHSTLFVVFHFGSMFWVH